MQNQCRNRQCVRNSIWHESAHAAVRLRPDQFNRTSSGKVHDWSINPRANESERLLEKGRSCAPRPHAEWLAALLRTRLHGEKAAQRASTKTYRFGRKPGRWDARWPDGRESGHVVDVSWCHSQLARTRGKWLEAEVQIAAVEKGLCAQPIASSTRTFAHGQQL